jgi:hypothetical protein
MIDSLLMMPEWYLFVAVLSVLALLSFHWPPLRWSLPLLMLAVGGPLVQASRCAARASFSNAPPSRAGRLKLRLLTACLHLLQPLARLNGRLRQGLTLWRKRFIGGFAWPRPWLANIWSKRSFAVEERLESLEANLQTQGALPLRGGVYDPWDLEVRGGLLGSARMFLGAEYHGDGRQLLRIRSWPRCSVGGVALTLLFTGISAAAAYDRSWPACGVVGLVALLLVSCMLRECAAATAAFLAAVRKIEREEKADDPAQ